MSLNSHPFCFKGILQHYVAITLRKLITRAKYASVPSSQIKVSHSGINEARSRKQ